MRKSFLPIFIFTCVLFTSLEGVIHETKHFDEILKYLKTNTLVVLDLDDTLLVPVQTLGSDVWFLYRVTQHEAAGVNHTVAFERALAEWQAIRHLTKMEIVEKGSEKVVEKLQQEYVVMGLTTQGLALATRTLQHLKECHIDLSKNAPATGEFYFMNQQGVLYRKGVLFTAGSPKGEALFKLLDQVNLIVDSAEN